MAFCVSRSRNSQRRFRPALDWLEDRLTPSGTEVTTFSNLSSPSIVYGTSETAITGNIFGETTAPTGNVDITIDGVTMSAAIDGTTGDFSALFSTATLSVANSPYSISYVYAGDTGYDPANDSGTLTVTPKAVTISGVNAADRPYDGTTHANLGFLNAQIDGLVNDDVVIIGFLNADGEFDDPLQGVDKPVTITGVKLIGPFAGNYVLDGQPSATASITGGDIVIAGTVGADTLVLSGSPGGGSVTYTLNGGDSISLTEVTSFTFNSDGGSDTMRVVMPEEGSLTSGGPVTFNAGLGANHLIVDASNTPVRTYDGVIVAGSVYGVTQEITYSRVDGTQLLNASAVDGFYGPNTAARDDAFVGLNLREHFVQALYLNALGRAGSIDEIDYWANQVGDPNSRSAISKAIESSFEARVHLVDTWYQTYLNREADSDESAYWTGQLLAGQTEETVLGRILGSPEFFEDSQLLADVGAPLQRYIAALYQTLLHRVPSVSELGYWSSVGDSTKIAQGILGSFEYRLSQVGGYYEALLHRTPDDTFLNNIAGGKVDLFSIRIGFDASQEFFLNG